MQSHTRKLAARVQQTLLALSDDGLAETVDHWFQAAGALYGDAESSALYGQGLGYRLCSLATGNVYESFAALEEAEPEAGEIEWHPPESGVLR